MLKFGQRVKINNGFYEGQMGYVYGWYQHFFKKVYNVSGLGFTGSFYEEDLTLIEG